MLLYFLFIITPVTLSLNCKDENFKHSENIVTSLNIAVKVRESVIKNDNSEQDQVLSIENISPETISDKDCFKSVNHTNNGDILETKPIESVNSTMETTATSFAQTNEETATINEYNFEKFEESNNNDVICTNDMCSTSNSLNNFHKIDVFNVKNKDNEGSIENDGDITTKSYNSQIDTTNVYREINKSVFTTFEHEINDDNLSVEIIKNFDSENKSFNGISSWLETNSQRDFVKTAHITPKKENNGLTIKPEAKDTKSIMTLLKTEVEVNSGSQLSNNFMNEFNSATVDHSDNTTEENLIKKDISMINGKENNTENSTTVPTRKTFVVISLNSTTDKKVVNEKPEFAFLKDDQEESNKKEDKQVTESKLEFPEVPEGENFHIQELGLSEGIFVFSYLSKFLSWIQPYDFPVELLRDALWSRVSVFDLITQSLQVEVGFIVCLSIGVFLALGVPCILIAHACCRLLDSNKRNSSWSEDSASEIENNCAVNFRRCTLVFVVQLIMLLLVAGIVAMFVTNEQMTRAVDQTPSVVHTALSDVITFLRNSHEQIQFVITRSLDQAVDAAFTDLDNVEQLLGRPIQDELAEETGVDVALDALDDVGTVARTMAGKVEDLLTSCLKTREMVMESREQLADLRMQVDMFRQQCTARFRPLCNTVNASGLDVVLRLDAVMSDDRLVQIRDLRDGNLSLVTNQARGEFQYIPLRVEKDTRNVRNGVKRQLSRQKEVLDSSIWSLDVVTRDLTYKIENVRNHALQIVQRVSAIEQWRWLTGLGAALSVLLLWVLLLSGITCGCCGAEDRAAPTLLTSVVLMCLFSIVLWAVALCALLVGGHGEVFICRPLYDEPGYDALTRLVDRPGVLFQRGGGFFSNLLYGNGTMDVPLRDVLQKCQGNGSTYSAFKLKKVFDVDSASNHRQWDMLHSELSRLQVNFSNMALLTPQLQHQLQELLHATTVNITNFRAQMTGQVTGKDLTSFADQMMSVANQITDWTTLNRLESLISTTRNIMSGHIQPLEQNKEDLVFQLTALEMQLAPLQRQVNQSLSHLKTIQYYINNQGDNIAHQKSETYRSRLIGYMDQYRGHVMNKTQHHVAPCRPIWNLYHAMRLHLCRHVMDPLNGFWFATVWCLLLFLAATPPCLKLIDHYKHLKHNAGLLRSRSSESPSETLMIPEQGAPWSTPGAPENDGW